MDTKRDVIIAISEAAGVTQEQAAAVLDAYHSAALRALADGGSALLPGMGKFTAVHKEDRQGRNPRTGETLTFAAKKFVKFKLAKGASDRLNEDDDEYTKDPGSGMKW